MITCYLTYVTNAGIEKRKNVTTTELKFRDRTIEHILKYSTIVFDDKTELWILGNEDEDAVGFVQYINSIKDLNVHIHMCVDATRTAYDEDIVDITIYCNSEMVKGLTLSFLETNLLYLF